MCGAFDARLCGQEVGRWKSFVVAHRRVSRGCQSAPREQPCRNPPRPRRVNRQFDGMFAGREIGPKPVPDAAATILGGEYEGIPAVESVGFHGADFLLWL